MENNMWISKIKINNFRNYNLQEINLEKNINVFYGENAQGKTNIIESIFYVVWVDLLELIKIKK